VQDQLIELEKRVQGLMPGDRRRLLARLYGLARGPAKDNGGLGEFEEQLAQAEGRVAQRRSRLPKISYPDDLPVSQRREEIAKAISENQVVVICGETGSGKTTQLPKICLELGRGAAGMIGHTQPRRIAARSVAQRIAEEVGTRLGDVVGYKVRFGDKTGPGTFVKVMTDGILLAETQGDRNLDAYDTLIIDEAHERSLNIDFLLGYVRTLLLRRKDLKVIITSATIDPQRFAEHFSAAPGFRPVQDAGNVGAHGDLGSSAPGGSPVPRPAPILMVSGRTYPVEVLYRPPPAHEELDELDDDMQRAILHAVDEAASYGDGDILVFLSGEREIRETAELLRKHHVPGAPSTAILPLFAKLSAEEQMRVFQAHEGRRIVLATNVAETSLTVPGIRYVVDVGFARINRYAPRTKVQRLEIEPISRASADQRKGRCGRLGPGVCVRLYTEADYLARPHFTDPEIVRANLASVILQMESLKLGAVDRFPFLDPPNPQAVKDGYETLHELGAMDEKRQLQPMGRELAKLPIDPRIGRMVLASRKEGCLEDVLVIASALSVQDPRDRPMEKADQADQAHGGFKDPQSDFASYLKLWSAYREQKRHLSGSKLRRWCKENFLSFVRLREWEDIHHQLAELVVGMQEITPAGAPREGGRGQDARTQDRPGAGGRGVVSKRQPKGAVRAGSPRPPRRDGREGATATVDSAQEDAERQRRYNSIHRALLTGLLGNVGVKTETGEYAAGRNVKFNIFPGSSLFRAGPKWVMAAELVRTTKLYARTVAGILPEWIEELGAHLVKRTYSEPHWSRQAGRVLAYERVTINGLELVARRRVHYGPIDPAASREIFVHHALVEGDMESRAPFYTHNLGLVAQVRELEVRTRKNTLLADLSHRFAFYDARVPKEVITAGAFERWRFEETKKNPRLLFMSLQDLVAADATLPSKEQFPDEIDAGPVVLPLVYRLEPGHEADGVTVRVPVEALGQLSPERFAWLVPGHVKEKVETIVRGLSKDFRRILPPASALASKCMEGLRFAEGSLIEQLRTCILKATTVDVPKEALVQVPVPPYLLMRFEVIGADGQVMAAGRDLSAIKAQLRQELKSGLLASEKGFTREGIKHWDFGDLPERVEIDRFGVAFAAFPGIVDQKASVALKLFDTFDAATVATRAGTRRLFMFEAAEPLKRHTGYLPGLEKMALQYATLGSAQQMKGYVQELIADRAFIGDQLPVRSEKEFAFRVGVGIDRLGAAVEEVTALAAAVLAGFQQVQFAVAQAKAPALAAGVNDIREQLGALTPSDFLISTPYQWLRHFPRYFQAIQLRLQKMPGSGLARDARNMAEITPLWRGYFELEKRKKELALNETRIVEYRWMVEEMRVSLFAQELRTAVPVSIKRIQELWAEIVKGAGA
jgi:ATP-dependent helicase HrpA